MSRYIPPFAPVKGSIQVPGDKSITHRGILLAGLGEKKSLLKGWLPAKDCVSSMRCMQAMGVEFIQEGEDLVVAGKGLYGLDPPVKVLDAENSGTTMRLLSGILAGQSFPSKITGDDSLKSRPMDRIIEPLRAMGAAVRSLSEASRAPLAFEPAQLKGIRYTLPVASAQVKSAILLAGLYAEGDTFIHEPVPVRDHTERLMKAMGVALTREGDTLCVEPKPPLQGVEMEVPGDLSSAAFFMALALVLKGSELLIRKVGLNPGRVGFIEAARRMGGSVEIVNRRDEGGEPLGDLEVKGSSLKGIDLEEKEIPPMIDELPLFALLATAAEGETRVSGAGELRHKESDRIAVTTAVINALGGHMQEEEDGFLVKGSGRIEGGCASSCGDHRIAMLLAIGGAVSRKGVTIEEDEAVTISYPDFFDDLERLHSQG